MSDLSLPQPLFRNTAPLLDLCHLMTRKENTKYSVINVHELKIKRRKFLDLTC